MRMEARPWKSELKISTFLLEMLQTFIEMENGQYMDASRARDSFLTDPLDQRERSKSHNDIMNRRVKNRERQRRYRARKRLEADTKKVCVINQSTPLQGELQLNGILTNFMTCVHCPRDWKKDARRACTSKEQEIRCNGPVNPALTLASESQAPCLPSGIKAEPPLESEYRSEQSPILDKCETDRIMLGRRDWKADARNKK